MQIFFFGNDPQLPGNKILQICVIEVLCLDVLVRYIYRLFNRYFCILIYFLSHFCIFNQSHFMIVAFIRLGKFRQNFLIYEKRIRGLLEEASKMFKWHLWFIRIENQASPKWSSMYIHENHTTLENYGAIGQINYLERQLITFRCSEKI